MVEGKVINKTSWVNKYFVDEINEDEDAPVSSIFGVLYQ